MGANTERNDAKSVNITDDYWDFDEFGGGGGVDGIGFGDDEDEQLRLSDFTGDLMGFFKEVPSIPDHLRKEWKKRIRKHQLRIKKKLSEARDGLRTIHEQIKKKGSSLRQKGAKAARRIITGSSNKRVRDFVKEPPVARMIDCISFTLGVMLLVSAEFFALKLPDQFWKFYIVTVGAMMVTRVCLWWGGVFKYFLFDFCYYVNLVLIIILIVCPENTTLLQVCFVWTNGPVGLAMVTWRNSLVFHSLEKVTSLYVHAAPPLLMMCTRWYNTDHAKLCNEETGESCYLPWTTWWGYSFALYLVWQLLQILLTEIIGRKEIERRKLQTSCRWIATHPRMPAHFISLRIARRLGIMAKDESYDHTSLKTKIIFVTFQAVYTLITMLPCKMLYESFWAHIVYLAVLYIYCVWNGARFYIHVFAERYILQFRTPDSIESKSPRSKASTSSIENLIISKESLEKPSVSVSQLKKEPTPVQANQVKESLTSPEQKKIQ
ncbi:hypothetical protein AAMO2058_000872500 [Amorphochlora amoebiformis]